MKTTPIRKHKLQTGLLASALCLLAGGLILLSPATGRAVDQNGTLKGGTTSGDWSDGNIWVDGLVAGGAGKTCSGNQVTSGQTVTVTVDSSVTIGNFYLRCNGLTRVYLFRPSDTQTITLAGGNSITPVDGPVVMRCPIAGTQGLFLRTYGNQARLILSATNTYSGDTQVSSADAVGGSLTVGVVEAIPHGAGKGNVVFTDAGEAYGILNLTTNNITINGLSGGGGQVTTWEAVDGTTTLTVGENNASGDFGGTIDDGTTTPARAVALTKIGSGTLTLSGLLSTYSGDTTVDQGTLLVNGSIGAGATPSAVKVAETGNGGTLGGTGTIYGPVTVYASGKIGAGTSAGILTIYGALDMSAPNTTCNWELAANSTATPGTDFDQIVALGTADVTDANLNIQFSGTATTPNGTGFWANNHSWLIMSGTVTGNFKNIQNGTNAAGYFYTTVDGSGVTLNFVKTGLVSQQAKITSIVPNSPNPTSVIVNYNNCVVGKTYFLEYKSPITGTWTPIGSGQVAAAASDSQTDNTASGSQRYYRVYYVGP